MHPFATRALLFVARLHSFAFGEGFCSVYSISQGAQFVELSA
jgi:hypothetical protein